MQLSPYRQRYATFFDWYHGQMDSLFAVPATLTNGLQHLGGVTQVSTRFNYFTALSRFYSAAVLSDLPRMPSETQRLIEQAAEHWSVTGECCLVQTSLGVEAIRPDYVFPVQDRFNQERVARFLFVYPQREAHDWDATGISSGKAMVVEYDVASKEAWMGIRDWGGGELSEQPKGSRVQISDVVWLRSGPPPYIGVESLVREINIRMNINQAVYNDTSFPLLQIDETGKEQLAEQIRSDNRYLGAVRMVAPPWGDLHDTKYVERHGNGMTEAQEHMRMLLGQLGVVSGVPDYVFGVQLGRPNNETERVLFAGQARVNSFRRSLEEGLARVGRQVQFSSEPFITRAEKLNAILAQVKEGIMSVAEAREALRLPREQTA